VAAREIRVAFDRSIALGRSRFASQRLLPLLHNASLSWSQLHGNRRMLHDVLALLHTLDEPTGQLDRATESEILATISAMGEERRSCWSRTRRRRWRGSILWFGWRGGRLL
jgi:hypothetical protein